MGKFALDSTGANELASTPLPQNRLCVSDRLTLPLSCGRNLFFHELSSFGTNHNHGPEMHDVPAFSTLRMTPKDSVHEADFLWQPVHFFEVGAVVSGFNLATSS
jgi:hypothetical protein